MLKEDLQKYKIGEICEIKRGIAFKKNQLLKKGIPILKKKNIQNGFVTMDDTDYCDPSIFNSLDRYLVKSGDVLIGGDNEGSKKIGINLTEEKFILSAHVFLIIPNEELLIRKYLYYWLLSNSRSIDYLVSDGSVGAIRKEDLLNLEISVPPLDVQKKIIEKLDHWQELIKELIKELGNEKIRHRYYRKKIIDFLNRQTPS